VRVHRGIHFGILISLPVSIAKTDSLAVKTGYADVEGPHAVPSEVVRVRLAIIALAPPSSAPIARQACVTVDIGFVGLLVNSSSTVHCAARSARPIPQVRVR
jgi:hypothetical protein